MAADENGGYCLWDLATRKPRPRFLEKPRQINWPTFSPESRHAAWLEAGKLCVMDRTWAPRILAQPPEDYDVRYQCLCFSPDGKLLACLDGAGELYCWDVATGCKKPWVFRHGSLKACRGDRR